MALPQELGSLEVRSCGLLLLARCRPGCGTFVWTNRQIEIYGFKPSEFYRSGVVLQTKTGVARALSCRLPRAATGVQPITESERTYELGVQAAFRGSALSGDCSAEAGVVFSPCSGSRRRGS